MKLYDNDRHRDSFTELVYSLLSDDLTWDRANQIIESFDSAPAVEVPDSIHPHGGPGDDSIEIVKPSEGDPHTYLKPCRICGNTEIVYERYRHQAGERWRCWCTKCLACIDPGWAQDRLAVRDIWNQEPSNEPLALEELREMDGEPAYFVCVEHPELSMWCIVWVDNIFGVKKVSGRGRTFSVHQEFCTELSYGKTWIAYRRKPEDVE